MNIRGLIKWFLLSITVVILTACGGGSSSDTGAEIYYETVTFEGEALQAHEEYLNADNLNYNEINTLLNNNANIEVLSSDDDSIKFKIDGIEFIHINTTTRDSYPSVGTAQAKSNTVAQSSTSQSRKRAIFLLPFAHDPGFAGGEELTTTMKNLLFDNGFDIHMLKDEAVSLRNITSQINDYDFIYINTHSDADGELVLGEKIVIDPKKYPHLFNGNGGRVGIRASWFQDKKLNDSIVTLNGCNSMSKSILSQTLIASGAKIVLGWDDYINKFNVFLADFMLIKLLEDSCVPFEDIVNSVQHEIINDPSRLSFEGEGYDLGEMPCITSESTQEDCNGGKLTFEDAFSHLKIAYGYDAAFDSFYLNANCNALEEETGDLSSLFSGKIFYGVKGNCGVDNDLVEVKFNASVTSMNLTYVTGPDIGQSRTIPVQIIDDKLVFDGDSYMMIASETNEYLLFNDFEADGSESGQERFYYDKHPAEVYLDSIRGSGECSENPTDTLPVNTMSILWNNQTLTSTNIITKNILIKENSDNGFAHIPEVQTTLNNGYTIAFKYCALNNTSSTSLCNSDDWGIMLVDEQHEVLYNSGGGGFSTADDPYNGKITGSFVGGDEISGNFNFDNMIVTIQ